MRKIVFDIETKNTFQEVGSTESTALDISLVGVYDSKTDSYSSYLENELGKLWPLLESADMIIGYNSLHFDLPLLNKYYHGDLSRIKHIDLLKEIRDSVGRRMKLDQVAEGTLGLKKSGHGLQAITWWRQGEIEKIRKYCLDDVKLTKELYEYALKNKSLKFKEGPSILDIKLDPSNWEKVEDSGLTFSLPF
ncbi:MAG: hypothetical protein RJA61_562 [Candidatus Parcubacteria bacterium]|jgi:DEAD/DEAH box helicase domain-containing protein